jgi:cytochrome d ubiquinol oxidase subunit II
MTVTWFVLILVCLVLYVLLDGYDLGIGIAALFERDPRRRSEMLERVVEAWDANESWLVLAVVSLWAGFPLAFGTILPHAYVPLIVVLLSLIVRGVSVEMASQRHPAPGWEWGFGVASLVAALAQGVAIATLTAKLTVVGGAFAGSAFSAIGWFAVLAALTVAGAYLAMGYAYLKAKETGELRVRAGRRGIAATATTVVLAVASLGALTGTAAPLNLQPPGRAFAFAGLLLFAAVGVTMALVTLRPASRHDSSATAGLSIATVAVLLAVVVGRYPVLAPPSLTVSNSVSPSTTMTFLAVGIGLNLPLILFYNWFAHHAFRGKAPSSPHQAPLLGAVDGH